MITIKETKLAIIGLGYVGLPLAVEFGRRLETVGFDIHEARIAELREGKDRTLEIAPEQLHAATDLSFTSHSEDIKNCNVYIVTVPTPITRHRQPDLGPLQSASRMLGNVVGKGDIVIFESTVYPGCTEEECIPIIEQISGLQFNTDFFDKMLQAEKDKA